MSDSRDFTKSISMVLQIKEDMNGHRQLYAGPKGVLQFHPTSLRLGDVGPLVAMLDQMLTAAIQRAGPDEDPHGFVRREQAIVHTALRQLRAADAEREWKELRAEQNAERARWEGEIEEMRAEWQKEREAWRAERAEMWGRYGQLERSEERDAQLRREARAWAERQTQPAADPESAPQVPDAVPEVPA